MARIMLASNASHDIPTNYLESWTAKILEKAAEHSDIQVFEIKKSTRETLTAAIVEKQPRLIILHGHGTEDAVCGYEWEILIKCDDNSEILSGKIVHALSCQTGKKLAPVCIKAGTSAYVGYKEDFNLWSTGRATHEERLKDAYAALFLDAAFEIPLALIEGVSVDEAFKRSQQIYKNNLALVLGMPQNQQMMEIGGALYHDLINQVYFGEGAAVF
jgi:alpha-L-arabinofuranosidase